MWRKAILSFKTVTPAVTYQNLNTNHHETLIKELTEMMEIARDNEVYNDMCYEYEHRDIPQISLHLNVAKIIGHDTSVFQNWPQRKQFKRKCLQIEVNADNSKFIQHLVELMKAQDLIRPKWGEKRTNQQRGRKRKDQEQGTQSSCIIA